MGHFIWKTNIKMRQSLVLCAIIAVAFAKKGKDSFEESSEKSSGLCIDSSEVAYLCTLGTPLGDKLSAAFATCAGEEVMAGRKGKGKEKKKCPSVDDIVEKVQEGLADEMCVFQQLGWLDNSYNFDNVTAVADISSLPGEVSAVLLDENQMAKCVQETMDYMSNDKKMKKCWNKYSEEDQATLMFVASPRHLTRCVETMSRIRSTTASSLQWLENK